jgi:outer membrane lipoprotein-sorting protein
MRPTEKIKRELINAKINTNPQVDKAILGALLDELDNNTNTRPAKKSPGVWDIIMKSNMTKLATAAMIIITVIIGLELFGDSNVAWADVLKNVENVKTYSLRMRSSSTTGAPDATMMVYFSSEYGSRIDACVNKKIVSQTYLPKEKKEIVMIIPNAKKYSRIVLTDKQIKNMRANEKDPKEFIKLFLSVDHKNIGKKTIDGVAVEGIEAQGPKVGGGMFETATGRLWVDKKTNYPVRMEIEGVFASGKQNLKIVMDNFQWDAALAESAFVPKIPEDYTPIMDITMPVVSEKTMIDGLRFFADLNKGKYPSNLAIRTVQKEMQEIWKNKKAPTTQQMKQFLKVNLACQLYEELKQDNKDVHYYGDKVTANDKDKILMKWKISENEHRVIYGDLRIETIIDSKKLLDKALKISGANLPPDKRGKVIRLLSLNEKDMVKGLGVWAELMDGKYPKSLDSKSAIKKANSLIQAKYGSRKNTDKKEIEGKVFDIFFASAFYDKLVKEKNDIAYYGNSVTVKDNEKVLVRWKVSKKQYRVILGDLTRKTVSDEELIKLEKQ